jgi:poly-gamma-glutamate synthesis protein (capsule biosynthesis protein)
LPWLIKPSKDLLSEREFLSLGAGNQKDSDFEAIVFQESGYNVYVLNACWDFLLYHQNTKDKTKTVNVIDELKIINWVKEMIAKDPKAKVMLYFHWSFDLETLPFPAYRTFSKTLIDSGASLVIGGHSHCIQGGEAYKNGHIAYGLGNFFIPNNVYANGKLEFPKMSNKGWGIEWDIKTNTVTNHWFEYSNENSNHKLMYLGKEFFNKSNTLEDFSLYDSLPDKEYETFFKKNRRKKKLIPIFYKQGPSLSNKLKMMTLKSRAKIARILAESGLIKWQS